MEAHNGSSGSDPSLGKFCGTLRPFTLLSSSNVMLVRFVSDDSQNFSGFQFTYSAEGTVNAWNIWLDLPLDGFQSRDVAQNNSKQWLTVKFAKDVFLFCFVHQYRDDEIRRKPPLAFQLSLWDTSRWNQLGVPRKSQFYQSRDWNHIIKVIHLNHYSFSQLFQLLSHLVPLIVSNALTEGVLVRNESVIFLMLAVIAPMNWIVLS